MINWTPADQKQFSQSSDYGSDDWIQKIVSSPEATDYKGNFFFGSKSRNMKPSFPEAEVIPASIHRANILTETPGRRNMAKY